MSLEEKLRGFVAERCGGSQFDKPSGGYAFSQVLAEERELEKFNLLKKPESALLKLSIADPTRKMPEGAMEAAFEYYRNCPDATRYTDVSGIKAGNGTDFGGTHEEIFTYLKKRNPGLTADFNSSWVQYSPGAIKRALAEYIPATFFSPDDYLIFPVPGYEVIASPINNYGINTVRVPLREEEDWKLPKTLNFPHTGKGKIILYLNTPHNPTGNTYNQQELKQIIDWARENNVLLIVDEAYDLLRYDESGSILNINGWEEVAVVLQSVSKGWNATGLRFGWVIAHPILIKAIRKTMDFKDSGMFGPSIAAGLWCLRHPEIARDTNWSYRQLHLKLAKGLREVGLKSTIPQNIIPQGGLCQFVKAPKAADGYKFKSLTDCVQWFRKKLRISLMHYDVSGQWYLRWAVTIKPVPECNLPDEISVIEEVCRRLKEMKFEF